MDTHNTAQAIVDSVAFAKHAHIDDPVSPDGAVRFHDHTTQCENACVCAPSVNL